VLQVKINVKSESELEMVATGSDKWGTCPLLKKDDPAGFALLSKYDKKTIHVAGDAYGSACGDGLYNIYVAAIYAPDSQEESSSTTRAMPRATSGNETNAVPEKITYSVSFSYIVALGFLALASYFMGYKKPAIFFTVLCISMAAQSSGGRADILCKNCGRLGYITAASGIQYSSSSYCQLLSGKSMIKVSRNSCSHEWVPLKVPEKSIESHWFTGSETYSANGPVIFQTEADFYHTAFWVGIGKDLRSQAFVIDNTTCDAMNSALIEKGNCYEVLCETQKRLAHDLSLPINDEEAEEATKELKDILTKYGHMKVVTNSP
jgi:hypothetical protein